jgi:hypothetical protein
MMLDFVPCNWTRAGRRESANAAYFISFPKSGRTWVRVFYFAYLSKLMDREFSLEPKDFPGTPPLFFTHERWEHRYVASRWDFIRGTGLLPAQARRKNKIVLMARDPRDVVVSLFFHLSKRGHGHNKWKPRTMPEQLRSRDNGIREVIELMNGWLDEWHGRPHFKLMRYEDCQQEPAQEFRGLLDFFGLAPVDEAAFAHALEFSRFENMQAAEAAGKFKEGVLRTPNPQDRDTYKARRGKVGGFRDYFNAEDQAYAAAQVRKLDPRFGYVTEQ